MDNSPWDRTFKHLRAATLWSEGHLPASPSIISAIRMGALLASRLDSYGMDGLIS